MFIVTLLQLKLSFSSQRDLPVRTNDDRHWDFVVAPGGPQAAAAAAAATAAAVEEYTRAAHSAAAAASRPEAGGSGGHRGRETPSSPRSPRAKRHHDPDAPITGGSMSAVVGLKSCLTRVYSRARLTRCLLRPCMLASLAPCFLGVGHMCGTAISVVPSISQLASALPFVTHLVWKQIRKLSIAGFD